MSKSTNVAKYIVLLNQITDLSRFQKKSDRVVYIVFHFTIYQKQSTVECFKRNSVGYKLKGFRWLFLIGNYQHLIK